VNNQPIIVGKPLLRLSSPSGHAQRILKVARDDDTFWNLSPSKSKVEMRLLVRPEIPEVYTHTNADWYKNRIIAIDRNDADVLAAHRIFLDCFAGEYGFIPNYAREPGLEPGAWTKEHLSKAQSKKYNKWGAVMSKLKDIPDLEKQDVVYLVGKLAGRDKLNRVHHQMSVRSVAVQLEKLCKSVRGDKHGDGRIAAIEKGFAILTGYKSFADAYNNKGEKRFMTDRGMGPHPKERFSQTVDPGVLNDAQLDELGQETDDEWE
jgi:hypothetical protein